MLALYTGRLFFGGGPEKYGLWAVGLLLIGVLPTSGMTISWTGFAKGNKQAATKMVVFGLVIVTRMMIWFCPPDPVRSYRRFPV